MLVTINSLEGLTPELLDQLDSSVEYIQVQDFYRYVRHATTLKDVSRLKGSTGNLEEKEDYVDSAYIYSVKELRQIIEKIQNIEKALDGYDDFTKAVIIYDRLKKHIRYDFEMEHKSSETRSMRGLISGKAVCAGYSEILLQVLKRQGIASTHVNGKGHAWTEIHLDGKSYLVDLTWDSTKFHIGQEGMDSMTYFGQNPKEFLAEHHDKRNLETAEAFSTFDKNDVAQALRVSEFSDQYDENDGLILTREDGTRFRVIQVGSCEQFDQEKKEKFTAYKYIYWEIGADGRPIKESLRILYAKDSLRDIRRSEEKNKYGIEKNADVVKECEEKYRIVANELFSLKRIKLLGNMNSLFLGKLIVKPTTGEIGFGNSKTVSQLPAFSSNNVRYAGGVIVERMGNDKFNIYRITNKEIERVQLFSKKNLLDLSDEVIAKLAEPSNWEYISKNKGRHLGGSGREQTQHNETNKSLR